MQVETRLSYIRVALRERTMFPFPMYSLCCRASGDKGKHSTIAQAATCYSVLSVHSELSVLLPG